MGTLADLGGVGNLISGAADVVSGFSISNKNWQRQKAMMREQMQWQERMSNTAHQREVADLEAAGLNPVLSANAGASTPANPSGVNPAEYSPLGLAQMQQAFANAREAKASAKAAEADAEMKEKDLNYWREHPDEFNSIRRNISEMSDFNTTSAAAQAISSSMDYAYWATHPDEFNSLRYNSVLAAENANLNSAVDYDMKARRNEWEQNHPETYSLGNLTPIVRGANEADILIRRNEWEQNHPNMYSISNMAPVISAGANVAGSAAHAYVGGKISKGMSSANAATKTIKANKIIIQRRK